MFAALATALTLLACQQLAGIEQLPGASIDGGVPDVGPVCVGLPTDGVGCTQCLKTSCCAETAACDRNVACANDRRCLSACATGDEPCRAACNVHLGRALDPLITCTAQHCAGECGAECGGGVGIGVAALLGPVALPECAPCIERHACDFETKCASRIDCVDALACIEACNPLDLSCRDGCLRDPEIHALYQGGWALEQQCSTECGFGRDYRCLPPSGHATWPIAVADGTIELTVPVVEPVATGLKPVEGAEVKVCAAFPIDSCDDGRAPPAHTGADGLARILVAVKTTVIGGFSGRLEVAKEGYVTVLRIPGPPPAGSQALTQTPLVPAALIPVLASQVGADASVGGIVIAQVLDCRLSTAPGVTLEIDAPGVVPIYFTSTTTISKTGPTTSTGLAGYFQVPDGNWTLTAHVQVKDKDVVLGRRLIPVRAGTITDVDLAPSP